MNVSESLSGSLSMISGTPLAYAKIFLIVNVSYYGTWRCFILLALMIFLCPDTRSRIWYIVMFSYGGKMRRLPPLYQSKGYNILKNNKLKLVYIQSKNSKLPFYFEIWLRKFLQPTSLFKVNHLQVMILFALLRSF